MKQYGLMIALGWLPLLAWAQGIQFFEGNWQQALEKAKKERKLIFVDAYTTWCGPCKKMASEVFTQQEVGDFYNKHFINVKMDMEKGEGTTFAKTYQVNSYPTLIFIDGDGKSVNVAKGSRPADQFIALGKATLNRLDKSTDYAEKYEEGERSAEFLRAYAYSLLTSGKPSLKIANEYLRTQTDLTTEPNREFLLDFCTECDSRIFDLILQNRDLFFKLQGEAAFRRKIEAACDATVQKAVEFETPSLLDEAKSKMKAALPDYAKEYALLADIQYYFAKNETEKTVELIKKYVSKFAKGNAEKLHEQAAFINQYVPDPKALIEAEKWAKQATELEKTAQYYKTYIELLYKNGKEAEATKIIGEYQRLQQAPPPVKKN